MEWQVKIGEQSVNVHLMANHCLTQWQPITVNDRQWEVCWNPKLKSFFLRDPENRAFETALRIADFNTIREADQLGWQVQLQGVYLSQSFQCTANILLSAPGVGQRAAQQQAQGCRVRSPMVGKILSIKVEKGQTVAKGEELLVIEAMKMENKIFAPQSGIVDQLPVQEGQQVALGEELLSLKAPDN